MLEKTQPRFEENRKIGIFTRILESVKSNIREILTNHGDTYMKWGGKSRKEIDDFLRNYHR